MNRIFRVTQPFFTDARVDTRKSAWKSQKRQFTIPVIRSIVTSCGDNIIVDDCDLLVKPNGDAVLIYPPKNGFWFKNVPYDPRLPFPAGFIEEIDEPDFKVKRIK